VREVLSYCLGGALLLKRSSSVSASLGLARLTSAAVCPCAAQCILFCTVVKNCCVTSIDQSGAKVTVKVKDGREFTGDRIISTIPFTVLQDVKVTPAWSSRKKSMFEQMEWDKTVKVIVQTKSPAWLSQGVHGWPMAGSDHAWERVVDITGNEPGGYGNVFFYLNGTNAERLLARPRETRAQEIVDLFEKDMPGLFDEVVTVQDFAWSEQPWIRASFGAPPWVEPG